MTTSMRSAATGIRVGVRDLRSPSWPFLVAAALWVAIGITACQSKPPPTLVERGNEAFSAGHYREADALFEQALAANLDPGGALHGRARVAVTRRDPEAALRFYGELSRVDRPYFRAAARDDYAVALLHSSLHRIDTGKPGAALDALRVLQKVDPDRKGLPSALGAALTQRGEQLAMHGRREEAMQLFREAIRTTPGQAGPYVGAAEILIASGRKRDALALLTEARRYNPSDSRVRALTVAAMGLY